MRFTDEEMISQRIKGKAKRIPFAFVLDALWEVGPVTKPMFGCLAIYVQDKIVLILRDKATNPKDNGVWIATEKEHHPSLMREFPKMRSLAMFGKEPTNWQLLPKNSPDFEEAVLHVCELVVAGDPRIGRRPKPRAKSRKRRIALKAVKKRSSK